MPPPTTTHLHPKFIHHHSSQSKIYANKKVFYEKNIKIFYSEINDEKHFDEPVSIMTHYVSILQRFL